MRTRRVLGGPVGAGGAPDGCPHLLEAVPCEGALCFRWRVAEVSICIPTNTKCGAGTQFQRVVCTDQRDVGPSEKELEPEQQAESENEGDSGNPTRSGPISHT
ncbi:unnamed protein product [Lampetra planeri]